MSDRFWGFDLGPLGVGHVLRVRQLVGFSDDGRTATVEVELRPSHRQQLTLSPRFRSREGAALEPTLIDVTTGATALTGD